MSRNPEQDISEFQNCRSVDGRDSDFDRKSSSNYLAVSAVGGIGYILLCGIVEVAFAYAKCSKILSIESMQFISQQTFCKAFTWGGIQVDQ